MADAAGLMVRAIALQSRGEFQVRSCKSCNPAHEHLHDPEDGPLFVCWDCGHWYYRGVDLTEAERG